MYYPYYLFILNFVYSTAFDADKYFEDLLKHSNLTDLIHKDKEMVTGKKRIKKKGGMK
jgi:hypothetical protein